MSKATNDLLGANARFDELMHRLKASGIGKSVSASEWQEVEEFIRENVLTKAVFDQIEYNKGYRTGHAEAIEAVKSLILTLAAESFKTGSDDKAHFLRDLSNSIKL